MDANKTQTKINVLLNLSKHYNVKNDNMNMIKYLLSAEELGSQQAMLLLGNHYKMCGVNKKLMQKYYDKIINICLEFKKTDTTKIEKNEKNIPLFAVAANNYGHYYQLIKPNNKLMIKYYLLATDNGYYQSFRSLAHHYKDIKDFENAKRYFLLAIEKNVDGALNDFGFYYHETDKNFDMMKKYYDMSIDKGFLFTHHNYGYYYQLEKDYVNMKKHYQIVIDKCDAEASINSKRQLAIYYADVEKNSEHLIAYCLEGIENCECFYNGIEFGMKPGANACAKTQQYYKLLDERPHIMEEFSTILMIRNMMKKS